MKGKAIIVTGAGRGIGAATARLLARLGAAVVINDIDPETADESVAAVRQAGGEAVAAHGDVADWEAAGRVIDLCQRSYGAVDGLVNNAGLFAMGRLDEIKDGQMNALFAANVIGTANCAAHAVKPMMEQRHGSIVNITSGAHMGIAAMGIYGATKGAVASFTYSWAAELAGSGVRVNAVSPLADTSMADISQAYHRARGNPPSARPAVQPEANAPVIAYLLSDAAAAVNGQIIRIEGEQLALMAHPAVLLPTLGRDGGWSFEAVSQAFDEHLSARQAPVGIAGVKVAGYGPPSPFWTERAKA